MIVSFWLVNNNDRYFLIDSGMGDMTRFIVPKYVDAQKLDAVFLTHGHSDHSGGISWLRKNFPHIPIFVDDLEIPYLTGEKPYPRRKKIEKKVYDRQIFSSLNVEESTQMQYNAGIEAIFSPGHSPGHNCFYHAVDNVVIAGDLFTTSRRGKLKPPMKQFTADMQLALKTGKSVLEKYPSSILSVCHGTEVENISRNISQLSWLNN